MLRSFLKSVVRVSAAVLASLFLFGAVALHDIAEYRCSTADFVDVHWDHFTGREPGDTYEMVAYNPESDIEVHIFVGLVYNHFLMRMPKTGHWILKVRSQRGDLISEWAESDNPLYATVNGLPRGWIVFAWIAPTGPIEL